MKKLTLIAAMFGAFSAMNALADTTTICTGSTAGGNPTAPASGTAGTHFMVTAMVPKCSANVNLVGVDANGGAFYAVGSNSIKGKSIFSGSTNGGAVSPAATGCSVAGKCELSEATSAATTAAGGGGSS